MRGLSAKELLELWERGMENSEIERGLLMLSYCQPEYPWDRLAAVTIGRRDAMLLQLRQATLGPVLNAFAVCPGCASELEFAMNTEELAPASANVCVAEAKCDAHEFKQGLFSVRCRLPDSTDLYAAGSCGSVEEARQTILSRCITSIEGADSALVMGEIPASVAEGFEAYLSEQEPAAEISLKLQCPSCAQQWNLALDIVSFFWREIQAVARRIALEVDALARSYGWGETEILSMTSGRRQLYLELVG